MSLNGISKLRPEPPSDRPAIHGLHKKIDALEVGSPEYWDAIANLAESNKFCAVCGEKDCKKPNHTPPAREDQCIASKH